MAKNELFDMLVKIYFEGKKSLIELVAEDFAHLNLNFNDVRDYINYQYTGKTTNEIIQSVKRLMANGFVA